MRARAPARLSILARLQLGLEALYRVETRLDVEEFLIDERQRQSVSLARAPREQLLIREAEGELSLGLFVDGETLANLERNDPAGGLDGVNFADFCLAVEGVSHFIYLALCAAGERSVSGLELELQAEVDKFACCLLVQRSSADLRRRLFRDVSFHDDLDAVERDRYRTANGEADRYAEALERRFVKTDRLSEMLIDLRRFYRLGLDGKLGHISRSAA
jgi:hypothetical protein